MKKVWICLALVLGVLAFASAEDDTIDIDGIGLPLVGGEGSLSSSDGENDEDGSSMVSDESSGASGSGEETDAPTTDTATEVSTSQPSTTDDVDVIVFARGGKTTSPKIEPTTEDIRGGKTKSPEPTTKDIAETTEKTTEGKGEQTKKPSIVTEGPSEDPDVNAAARSDPEEKVLRVLTTEVIAAVVVGAVCAVILIAFLVYRLRKRDEGSYPLSDSSYKDTYKLRGDTGKEAFV